MAKPGRWAPPVNSDDIRATKFVRGCGGWGYDASEVDDLLRRVTGELDAGRPAGPLIENAAFRKGGDLRFLKRPYDIDAVDWFLDQLLLPPGRSELAGLGSDLWRDLPVAQVIRDGVSEPASQPGNRWKSLAGECASAWRNFGQQPGTYLRWEWVKRSVRAARNESELRTADQQTIASLRGAWLQAAGRSFTLNTPAIPGRSAAGSWPPGIAELAARSWRDIAGHYAAETMKNSAQRNEARRVGEFVDEAGTPILYISGRNFGGRACARVTFPDQRWLRFLVRGTKRANAIMTAVDQTGNKVARYRDTERGEAVEIAVHPDRKLTDELLLAIAISPGFLAGYFASPG